MTMRWLGMAILFLLVSCGGEWASSPDSAVVTRCYTSQGLPAGRSAVRAALVPDGSALYILDNWATVYRYSRDPVRSCGWEADPDWQNEGQWNLSGFPDDLDFASGALAYGDGSTVTVSTGWECRAESGPMILAPGATAIAVGTRSGVRIWNRSGTSCARSSLQVGSFAVWGLAQDASGYYTVEGAAMPQNLAVYDRNGGLRWREPLSVAPDNPKYFCGVDRLRAGNTSIFLLDQSCGRLGVFDNDGVWRKTLSLDSLGIRRPLDIMPGEYGTLYILTGNSQELTVRLSSLLL